MANTFTVSRSHLIFGLCMPLAILLGYLMAEPLESSSLAVVVMVLSVLCVPVMMACHHPLLIFCWNAMITPQFFPGHAALWTLIAFVSLFFALASRTTSSAHRFLSAPGVTRSLLCLILVVLGTAMVTGGIGMRALGAEKSYGGRGYFYLVAAVVGYFALTSQAIPRSRAYLYTSIFFLSGLTSVISNLAYVAGSSFYFLYGLFPPELAFEQAMSEGTLDAGGMRITGLVTAAPALYLCLLARCGIRGLFEVTRPWRMALFLAAPFAVLFGGYRSGIIFFGLVFFCQFMAEGLWRTRYLLIILCGGLLLAGAFLPFIDKMPWSVQRTLSFLPIGVDPLVKQGAQSSTDWRLELWRIVLPEVPKYLFKGKGYAIPAQDLSLMVESTGRTYSGSAEVMAMTGDYHNGPLSVVIPFGIYGLAAFIWFLAASIRVLYLNFRHGAAELRPINTTLLAVFIAHIIQFCVIFGAFYWELFTFTGLVGLSVSLNGGVARPDEESETAID